MTFSRDQVRHDIINLHKTIKLLEDTISNEDWSQFTTATQNTKWLKAQTVIGGVTHCRKVLTTLPNGDYSVVGTPDEDLVVDDHFIEKACGTLRRLETVALDANERLQPLPPKLSIEPKLPRPTTRTTPVVKQEDGPLLEGTGHERHEALENDAVKSEELIASKYLLDPLEPESASSTPPVKRPFTLLPPSAPSTETSSKKAIGTPVFLSTSTALHDDLAGQLAQMAEQLKRNAVHFAEALEKDRAVLKDTDEKLDANYDNLGKERIRLRDHRGKSGGTTCLVITSILVVIASFIVMLAVMRIT